MAEIIYLGGNYMLENWIKPQIPEEEELEERLHAARSKLSVLQMQIKEHGLPVLVLFGRRLSFPLTDGLPRARDLTAEVPLSCSQDL